VSTAKQVNTVSSEQGACTILSQNSAVLLKVAITVTLVSQSSSSHKLISTRLTTPAIPNYYSVSRKMRH